MWGEDAILTLLVRAAVNLCAEHATEDLSNMKSSTSISVTATLCSAVRYAAAFVKEKRHTIHVNDQPH